MKFSGQILKMISEYDSPIQYYLNLSGDLLHMNQLLYKKIILHHIGYQCVSCGKDIPLYRMGFCKDCFFKSPYASETIIRPELSQAHLGIEERDLEVEEKIQLVPHIVYLSYTSEVKVGVTRESQIPTRWIDQGALQALPIARTENRYEAGVIEVALKEHLADKTNYRQMLSTMESNTDLNKTKQEIIRFIPEESQQFILPESELWNLKYPYEVPEKITSFSLDKKPELGGILKGIKGQYLCFDEGNFINIRSHEGYVIDLTIQN